MTLDKQSPISAKFSACSQKAIQIVLPEAKMVGPEDITYDPSYTRGARRITGTIDRSAQDLDTLSLSITYNGSSGSLNHLYNDPSKVAIVIKATDNGTLAGDEGDSRARMTKFISKDLQKPGVNFGENGIFGNTVTPAQTERVTEMVDKTAQILRSCMKP